MSSSQSTRFCDDSFLLDPLALQRASVPNRLLPARRLVRRYVENCQWKLSANTALKLFNNFSAGTRSCWLIRKARTQDSKKCTRLVPQERPHERACYISPAYYRSSALRVSRHVRFETFLFFYFNSNDASSRSLTRTSL